MQMKTAMKHPLTPTGGCDKTITMCKCWWGDRQGMPGEYQWMEVCIIMASMENEQPLKNDQWNYHMTQKSNFWVQRNQLTCQSADEWVKKTWPICTMRNHPALKEKLMMRLTYDPATQLLGPKELTSICQRNIYTLFATTEIWDQLTLDEWVKKMQSTWRKTIQS